LDRSSIPEVIGLCVCVTPSKRDLSIDGEDNQSLCSMDQNHLEKIVEEMIPVVLHFDVERVRRVYLGLMHISL